MRIRPATASALAQVGLTAGMTDAQIEQWLADHVTRPPEGMSRRAFLAVMGMGTAAVATGIWVPERKAIFMPPERSVVMATESDLAALKAAFPGPFMTPSGFGLFDPSQALRWLSDEEYALCVKRGKALLGSAGLVAYNDPDAFIKGRSRKIGSTSLVAHHGRWRREG